LQRELSFFVFPLRRKSRFTNEAIKKILKYLPMFALMIDANQPRPIPLAHHHWCADSGHLTVYAVEKIAVPGFCKESRHA